jgi:hypothetical protein
MLMRRIAILISLAAALALLPTQAASADILDLTVGVFPDDELAALSSSGDPFAVGGGTLSTGTHFAFSAHLGPSGPSGYAVVSNPALGEAQGHVCAYFPQLVPPNFASFVIVVERGSGYYGSFSNLQFFAGDLGEPSSGARDLLALGPTIGGCTTGGEPPIGSVIKGNIVVRL